MIIQIPKININNREAVFSANSSIIRLIFNEPKLTWKKKKKSPKHNIINKLSPSWGANREAMII